MSMLPCAIDSNTALSAALVVATERPGAVSAAIVEWGTVPQTPIAITTSGSKVHLCGSHAPETRRAAEAPGLRKSHGSYLACLRPTAVPRLASSATVNSMGVVGTERTYAVERCTATCGLYKDKVTSCSGNDKVVSTEHSSCGKPPDGVASRVGSMVTSTPFCRFDTDVGCALEFQGAPVVELEVSKRAAKRHFAWEMREHRRGTIRPLSPPITGAKLECAVGYRARRETIGSSKSEMK